MKTVSVVMCTYNGAKYLREQLDSILQQTYPIYELIIQDDCSTDGTIDIIREYMVEYPFVKLFVNEHNLGFNSNFKSAVMKATGDYVAISDQDDIWFLQKIEKQVKTIGNYDICCSYCTKGPTQDSAKLLESKFNFERQLFSSIYGHTMLCHRQFIQTEQYWLPSIWYDWSLALHAYLNNGVIAIKEPLNWHREHDQEISCCFKNNQKHVLIEPYIKGYVRYRKLQQEPNWQFVYNYLFMHTEGRFPLVHEICRLLLKTDNLSLLRLCYICYKHRDKINPNFHIHGFMGSVRSFFYPFFFSYFNQEQLRYLS